MRRTMPLVRAIAPQTALTVPARAERPDRSTAKVLRFFSKPTLVEYIAVTSSPKLFGIRYEMLYLIELRNAAKAQIRLQGQWKQIHAYLLKRKAIRVDGDAIWFCEYGRRRAALLPKWKRMVALAKRYRRLDLYIKVCSRVVNGKED